MYYEVVQVQPLTAQPICEVLSTGLLNDTFRTKYTNASDLGNMLGGKSEDLQCLFTHMHKRKELKTSSWEEIMEVATFFSP